jgi:hypothetical protein
MLGTYDAGEAPYSPKQVRKSAGARPVSTWHKPLDILCPLASLQPLLDAAGTPAIISTCVRANGKQLPFLNLKGKVAGSDHPRKDTASPDLSFMLVSPLRVEGCEYIRMFLVNPEPGALAQ